MTKETFRKGLIENVSLEKKISRGYPAKSSFDNSFLLKKRFDDGSSDGTSGIAREAGAQVIRHDKNRGTDTLGFRKGRQRGRREAI